MSTKSERKQRRRQELAERQRANPGGQWIDPNTGGPIVSASRVQVSASYSGPIPPPGLLQGYEDVVEGSARTIIEIFHAQATHRMALESQTVTSDIRRSWAGLACGLFVATLVIAMGFIAIMYGHDNAGSALSLSGLSGLVGTFVYGTHSKRAERLERTKALASKK